MLATFARRALRNPRLAWALIAEPVDPLVDAERLAYRSRYAALIAEGLRDGIAAGELPAQDAELTAAALVGGCGEALVGPLSPVGARRADPEAVIAGAADVRRPGGGGGDERRRSGRPATGPVTTVTLSRPERRNAVDGADRARRSPTPSAPSTPTRTRPWRSCTAPGGVFCAGADLNGGRPSGRQPGRIATATGRWARPGCGWASR